MKSRIVCFLYLIVCIYIYINRDQAGKFNNYYYDNGGYYAYLPAIFIYNDLQHLAFKQEISTTYNIPEPYNGIHDIGGRKLDKYPVGTSLFELPTFLIAHAYCVLLPTKYPADGYSLPYEYGLIFATAVWSFLGLWVLRKFLLRNFSDGIAAIVLLCIGFGTNFYTYGAFNPGMSHNFSFFLFACLIHFTDKWYHTKTRKDLCFIGIIIGLIGIVRPVNLVGIIIPLLWGVYNRETLAERWNTIITYYKDFLLAGICFLGVVFIQLSYWQFITSHWIYNAYINEEFWFSNPRIFKGLFSFRKGWFVYTPIAFAGLLGLFYTPRKYVLSLLCFFALAIYITFSWENWYYGAGFGARALIETLPVVAFPLAFLLKRLLEKTNTLIKPTLFIVLFIFISLNMFQSYQFAQGIIDAKRMSWKYYRYSFGKLKVSPESESYLMSDKEYWDEIAEWESN
jgi:hypothetical protein